MAWLSCILSNVALASLLAVLAWFVQRWLGRPAISRFLWVLVLIKLVTPPLVSVPLGESASSLACALGTCGCAQHATSYSVLFQSLPWILLSVWSAGAATMAWTTWRRWSRFRALLASALPAPPEWQSQAHRLACQLSVRRPPEILLVPGRLPPLVVAGWSQPRLLVPLELLSRLSGLQPVALLLHELVHIKRGDHLVRILESAVGVAYWWLPMVGVIGRQLRACEESCCDAAVVACLPQGRRDYARLLLDVIDFADPLPAHVLPQATAMSAARDLEQRLRAILRARQQAERTWPGLALAAGLACAILPCELRYGFVRGPLQAAREPAAAEGCLPSSEGAGDRSALFCCPS